MAEFPYKPCQSRFFVSFLTSLYKLLKKRIFRPGREIIYKCKIIQKRQTKKSCFMTFFWLLVKKSHNIGRKAKRDYLFTTKRIALHSLGPPCISCIK